LVSRAGIADVIRLRDRAAVFAAAAESRGRRGFSASVLVVAEPKSFGTALGEVQHVLRQSSVRATVIGGLPHDPKGAALFTGETAGRLEKTQLIKTARGIAQQLVGGLAPAVDPQPLPQPPAQQLAGQPIAGPARVGRHHAQDAGVPGTPANA